MDIMQTIKNRYSCRSYNKKPIEKEKLGQILEAARLAPSAWNRQSWRFVVITGRDIKNKLVAEAVNQKFFADAGAIIIGCSVSKNTMTCGQKAAPIDVAIAMENIALAATGLGLETCWIGSFFPEKVRVILSIPDDVEIVELMALGYPADKGRQAERLPIEKIVSFEKWCF